LCIPCTSPSPYRHPPLRSETYPPPLTFKGIPRHGTMGITSPTPTFHPLNFQIPVHPQIGMLLTAASEKRFGLVHKPRRCRRRTKQQGESGKSVTSPSPTVGFLPAASSAANVLKPLNRREKRERERARQSVKGRYVLQQSSEKKKRNTRSIMEQNVCCIIRYGYWVSVLPTLSFISTKQVHQIRTKNYFAMEIF
jgi:hypothetical protein